MSKPLEGVRVIDMSHVIAGPLASFYLAQLGAEVIKVEAPQGGEVMRTGKPEEGDTPTGFVALNAGKRSLAIDIRTAQGAQAVRDLARTADVFIENFRPGVVAKYGLHYEAISALKPDMIYCSISGYGQAGEWSGRGAYDHVVQALTGMMMMSGENPSDPPVKVGFPVIDVAVGMLGALSIVSALHRRDRDGIGQQIDASMVQASLMLMYPSASTFLTNGAEPQRVGNRGYTGSPTADTYRCRDGWQRRPTRLRSLDSSRPCWGLRTCAAMARLWTLSASIRPAVASLWRAIWTTSGAGLTPRSPCSRPSQWSCASMPWACLLREYASLASSCARWTGPTK